MTKKPRRKLNTLGDSLRTHVNREEYRLCQTPGCRNVIASEKQVKCSLCLRSEESR